MPDLEAALAAQRRAADAFNPADAPKPRPDLIARIDAEVAAIERKTREMTTAGRTAFEHSFFDHHREQLPR